MQFQNAHLTRQLDLIPVGALAQARVHVIGCGAIGSFVAMQLAKMGVNDITVYDMDTVSIENMSNQNFRFSDIGKNKAEALAEIVRDFTGVRLTVVPRPWSPLDQLSGIVVSAVDSMDVRKEIWNKCKMSFNVTHVIDPRMGAEVALLYTMSPHNDRDREAYETTMYSDKDSVQEKCTAKSTIYTANLLSGLCSKTIKNLICKQDYPRVTQWGIGTNEMLSFTEKAQ